MVNNFRLHCTSSEGESAAAGSQLLGLGPAMDV